MGDTHLLSDFFREHGPKTKEAFLKDFDGAFLLGRFKGGQPYLYFLPRDEAITSTIGGDEDEADFDFCGDPTLDPIHAKITYHTGFRGWMLEDMGTSFGTHVDGDRIVEKSPTLLTDRVAIKPGGGLCELQFYISETLYVRMSKAGIVHSLKRRKSTGQFDVVKKPKRPKAD